MGTIPKSESFWEDPPLLNHSSVSQKSNGSHSTGQHSHLQQYERNLNFSTVAVEDNDYGFQKKKAARDPLSHRIIEKRRRDRMNNCLADLARLLPQASLRKGRGRIEKTEIVELAIKHLKHLQSHPCPHGENCEFSPLARQVLGDACNQNLPASSTKISSNEGHSHLHGPTKSLDFPDQFRLGYQECLKETMHFLMEKKGTVTGDNLVQLVDYLNRHAESFIPMNNGNLNTKVTHGYYRRQSPTHCNLEVEEVLSDGDNEVYSTLRDQNDDDEIDQKPLKISLGFKPSGDIECGQDLENRDYSHFGTENQPEFEYDGDNNSCSSTPLSIEISDVLSCDEKPNSRSTIKPPVPSIIGSHSSSASGSSIVLSSSNGRSSDEGSASISIHRYKFKNTIKQRFTADLETTIPSTSDWNISKHHHRHHYHHRLQLKTNHKNDKNDDTSSSNPSEELGIDDEQDQDGGSRMDLTQVVFDEKPELQELNNQIMSEQNPTSLDEPDLQPLHLECEKNYSKSKSIEPGNKIISTTPKMMKGVPIISVTNSSPCTIGGKLESNERKSPLPNNTHNNDNILQKHQVQLPRGFQDPITPNGGVPAFALHEKGLYYIPLTLDKSYVTPFITALDSNTPVLHPVTISVCFLLNPTTGESLSPHRIPSEMKFSPDLLNNVNVQSVEALNLTKLSSFPSNTYNPSNPTASFIMNRFTQSQSQSRSYLHNNSINNHQDCRNFGSVSPNIKYPSIGIFPTVGSSHDSGGSGNLTPYSNHNSKLSSPIIFPSYDFQNSRPIVPNHTYSNHSHSHSHSLHNSTCSSSTSSSLTSATGVANSRSRKRHMDMVSPSDSSSTSVGYHSWRSSSHFSTNTESLSDETNLTSYGSGTGSYVDDSVDMVLKSESSRSKSYHHNTTKGQRNNGVNNMSKRQRKGTSTTRADTNTITKGTMSF